MGPALVIAAMRGAEVEEWRPVAGWEGLYEVSSVGRVRTCGRRLTIVDKKTGKPYERRYPAKIMRPCLNTQGYPSICFTRVGVRRNYVVHRLVCLAFHGPPPEGKIDASHIDGRRTNPRADNVRWATRTENLADRVAHGTLPQGASHGRAKLSEADVLFIRSSKESTQSELAQKFGVKKVTISNIMTRKTWTHI